uniref:Uncharacterized protein n=1 Tax=Panagrolaimus sp. PS1159 TaxID=55785 RepID=A0AC35GEH7_9BILA
MNWFKYLFILLAVIESPTFANIFANLQPDDGDYRHLYPKLCLSMGIKRYGHALSYSVGMVENLRYPKDRMHISFFILPECDDTSAIEDAKIWSEKMSKIYSSTAVFEDRNKWMEASLQWGRKKTCDYLFMINEDNFLMNNVINQLINLTFVAVSPLMNDPFGRHSNVYGLLDTFFVDRKRIGSQQVYYFNLPIFINLKSMDSSYLTFDSDNIRDFNQNDPIQIFAHSAYSMNIPLFVDNKNFYGYILDSNFYSKKYYKLLVGYFLANLISEKGSSAFPYSNVLNPRFPSPSTFGFDMIYVINLKRRPERLQKIDLIMKLLGIKYQHFEAVDGKALTDEDLLNLKFMPEYEDPFAKRPMTLGEVGCFLSHYKIWEDTVKQNYQNVIIFEDDIKFVVNSTNVLNGVMEDLIKTQLEWDIIYFGRKKMTSQGDEFFVQGHRYLSTLAYSYWTLGYALSLNGAKKLIEAKPLENLLTLDEFLPIMYNQHPNKEWSKHFKQRNLNGYAVYPVIVTPERYTYDDGYISDTEVSAIINVQKSKKNQTHFKREYINHEQSNMHASSTLAKNEL